MSSVAASAVLCEAVEPAQSEEIMMPELPTVGRRGMEVASFTLMRRAAESADDKTDDGAAGSALLQHRGRLGKLLVLEIRRGKTADTKEGIMQYREYTRSDVINKLHRLLAKNGMPQMAPMRRQSSIGRVIVGDRSSSNTGMAAVTHGLVNYRDLHTIDPAMDASSKPALVVRRGCILVTMPPLHAIIMGDHVMLLPEEGADGDLEAIIAHLRHYDSSAMGHIYGADASPPPPPPPQPTPTPGAGVLGGAFSLLESSSSNTGPRQFASPPPTGVTPFSATGSQGTFEFETLSVILNSADAMHDKELERLSQLVKEVALSGKHTEIQLERLQHAEETAKGFIAGLEAVIKTVEIIRDTPQDLEGLILSIPLPTEEGGQPGGINRSNSSGGAGGDVAGNGYPTPLASPSGLVSFGMSHRVTVEHGPQGPPMPQGAGGGSLSSDMLLHLRNLEAIRFEELLEWYLSETENNLSDARLLVSRLDGEMKHITLALASKRNRLLKINIAIQIFTSCLAACSMVSGYFGMNLDNGSCGPDGCHDSAAADHGHFQFLEVSLISAAIAITIGLLTWSYVAHIAD